MRMLWLPHAMDKRHCVEGRKYVKFPENYNYSDSSGHFSLRITPVPIALGEIPGELQLFR